MTPVVFAVFLAVSMQAHDHAPAAEHAHAHSHADARSLHDIMYDLGRHMLALTDGLMVDDADAVKEAAAAMVNHAPIADDDLERIARVLGAQEPAFHAMDEATHHAAMRLHDAADSGRTDEILRRLYELQQTCVACQTQFRERLRSDVTSHIAQ